MCFFLVPAFVIMNLVGWKKQPEIVVIFLTKKITLLFNQIENSALILRDKEELGKQTIYVYDSILRSFILKFSISTSKFLSKCQILKTNTLAFQPN